MFKKRLSNFSFLDMIIGREFQIRNCNLVAHYGLMFLWHRCCLSLP